MKRILFLVWSLLVCCSTLVQAQELQARITVNHNQIQGTDNSVFENLQQTLEQFVNDQQWTSLQFQKNERIQCTFNITITKYDASTGLFTANALIQANRPVYNSGYTTTLYNNKDNDFNFDFQQFNQLNYNPEQIDNQLVALMAYYAYLIIGLDLDSFAPMGGEEVLQQCMYLTNNAQNLSYTGWGLDEMANNAERGRTNITNALLENLKKAREDKPLSLLPQIWTDYKRDELASIYEGKGTQKEKESIYELLFSINASQNNAWERIKK